MYLGLLNAAESKQTSLQNFEYEKDGRTILSADSVTGDIDLDDELTSNVQIVAVGVTELGLTFSREFEISGEKIAIGLTPKLQNIRTYNYVATVDDEDIKRKDISETEKERLLK